ncbi:MAG: single-stranded DNA-binding protein [Deltaproteobacteria bacterium]|jgi:single-strand selective monofunctional uracil DNA glycosylase
MSLEKIAKRMSKQLAPLEFAEPVTHVYDPLQYAWAPHQQYLSRFDGTREYVLLGMNPGPWGMAQTGVPFGEVNLARDWIGITGKVKKPKNEHPKRPIEGFDCQRSEVSGARIWGWARDRFGDADKFFSRFYVGNYCPLVFMEASGKNRTPDKLPVEERTPLLEICDRALRDTITLLKPKMAIGVGAFAEKRLQLALDGMDVPIGRILHPSPASPIANRGWAERAEAELEALGVKLP